jgi:hypothetical protein
MTNTRPLPTRGGVLDATTDHDKVLPSNGAEPRRGRIRAWTGVGRAGHRLLRSRARVEHGRSSPATSSPTPGTPRPSCWTGDTGSATTTAGTAPRA